MKLVSLFSLSSWCFSMFLSFLFLSIFSIFLMAFPSGPLAVPSLILVVQECFFRSGGEDRLPSLNDSLTAFQRGGMGGCRGG